MSNLFHRENTEINLHPLQKQAERLDGDICGGTYKGGFSSQKQLTLRKEKNYCEEIDSAVLHGGPSLPEDRQLENELLEPVGGSFHRGGFSQIILSTQKMQSEETCIINCLAWELLSISEIYLTYNLVFRNKFFRNSTQFFSYLGLNAKPCQHQVHFAEQAFGQILI